jgi:hypothetical protein
MLRNIMKNGYFIEHTGEVEKLSNLVEPISNENNI